MTTQVTKLASLWVVLACVCFCPFRLRGQQAGGGAPYSGSAPTNSEHQAGTDVHAQVEPEPGGISASALTGVLSFAPGGTGSGRSYLLPSLGWTGTVDTNPYGGFGRANTLWGNTLMGSLTLQRVKRHTQLNLEYQGGGFAYNRQVQNTASKGTVQSLGIFQSFDFRRWSFLVGDQGQYSPESPYGSAGLSGLNSFGGGLGGQSLGSVPGLNDTYLPNQTILTGYARRISNAAFTQLAYRPGRRSTITASAVLATLNFLKSGYIDSKQWIGTFGYEYAVSEHDSVGISYVNVLSQFSGPNPQMRIQELQGSYGHRISRRLSLKLSGGPMLSWYSFPMGAGVRKSEWVTSDSLQCNFAKGSIGLSFTRTPTGGSGVLPGAVNNMGQVNVSRNLNRTTSASLSFGRSSNRSMPQQLGPVSSASYNVWLAGAMISRQIGKTMSFYLQYNIQRQSSNQAICYGGSCAQPFTRQVGGIGLNWHGRPLRIK